MRAQTVDRLTPSDLAVLWPEDLGWPQDIGLLAILDDANDVDAERLRAHVRSRIGLFPLRFRAVLVRPGRGLGGPYWADAPALDLAYHVRERALPAGAGEDELLEACETVRRGRFDPSQPLWHLTLLRGLPDGRVGLLMDAHHCLVDGLSGVAALAAFADLPEPRDVPTPPVPRPAPTTGELLLDVVVSRLRKIGGLAASLRSPRRLWRELARDARAWRRTNDGGPTPSTSLNTRLGPGRRYALIRSELDRCKAVAHAHDATVNDVLLCALAGGLRALLQARGELLDGMVLRAAVPVSLHAGTGAQAEGNRDGGVLLSLPVGEKDPAVRLRLIAKDSAFRKRNAVLPGAGSPFFRAAVVQRLVLRLTPNQRMSNSYVANVPGPPRRLSLAGAQILEMFPLVPLIGNITVGIGALSYAGRLAITVVVDDDACPDLDVVVTAMKREMSKLARIPTADAARLELSRDGVP